MKILHVNKFLYRRGGADAYMLDLSELQREVGHEVAHFAMAHPMNLPSRFSDAFPPHVELNPFPASLRGKVTAAGRVLYSPSARRGMEQVLNQFRPDVVHVHNIYHQLSPSILRPLARRKIPAVMTLHDYKLACPTYLFLDHGEVCEACLGGHFYQAVLRRCNNGSLAASSLNALELSLHTITKAYGAINLFLCPSRFLMNKMAEGHVFPERLRHLPIFVDHSSISPKNSPGGGVVYAGRLSKEKGVDILIEAARDLDTTVAVAGDGPERAAFEARAAALGTDKIRFHGYLPRAALHRLTRSASATVLPSRCHENQPLSVLESFACGVPVVGTDLGGVPELITPGVDGDLFRAGSVDDLRARLGSLLADPTATFRMGIAGRAKVETDFSVGRHLGRLETFYEEAIDAARRRRGARPRLRASPRI
jgi:glycosyltransferase involved in cell wall biosynthesis